MDRYLRCLFPTARLFLLWGMLLLVVACAPIELAPISESASTPALEKPAAPVSSPVPALTSAPALAVLDPVTRGIPPERASPLPAEETANPLKETSMVTTMVTSTEALERWSQSSPVSPVSPVSPTTTAETPAPTVEPVEPAGPLPPDAPMAYVNHGGNLRTAPRVAPDSLMGQVCPGDLVALLENQPDWYYIQVVQTMADCVSQRVGAGTEGWISSNLVTPTAPGPEGYPNLPGGLVSAIVREVLNGHTMEVAVSGVVKRVNLIGINAPLPAQPDQSGECFGAEAMVGLKELLNAPFVLLETDETQGELDRQGQLLAYVWLPDGRMVNYEMVARGYAYGETFNLPYTYQEVFDQVEREAREQQRGLWSPETCRGERQNPAQEQEPDSTPLDPSPMAEDSMPAEPTLPPPPAPMPPPQTPQRDFDRNGDGEVTCEDFTTCDEAFDALDGGYTHLDYDHDGIPCKELCGN
ncbi:MAG: SH3 domain-containing protein [Chloroflexaceae bacterium]|nr:SH3 domain-containing protein [Chloroflexaceae bacterium]